MKLVKNTIGHLLLDRLSKTPHSKAVGFFKESKVEEMSFTQYKVEIEKLSLALIKKGVIRQDKICILSQTRIEWNLLDLAVLCSGAVTVPIYQTYTSNEVLFILNHCEAKMVIVENDEQFLKICDKIDILPHLKFIISIEELNKDLLQKLPSNIFFFTLQQFQDIGKEEVISNPDLFELKVNAQHDDNIATIVYTSGTTGNPKGAVIRHGALLRMLTNINSFAQGSLNKNDTNLIFLPLAHVLGRCDSLLNLTFGCKSIYAESIDQLLPNIAIVRPTFMIAVPRIFEKIFEKVKLDLDRSNKLKKGLFNWGMATANTYFQKIDDNRTPTPSEIVQFNIAKNLIFKKVYERFGGRIRYFISGGAPLAKEITQFLRNSGLVLVEGYGLTETIAPCILNPFDRQKAGTVGKPIGDVEVSFDEDSEILIRSEALFDHYLKSQEETSEVLAPDGWFKTGDIGSFDSDGYLKITGRKKDIIITSGGKNVAPQKIENILKLETIIEHCCVVGDSRKYLTALIALNENNLREFRENPSQIAETIRETIKVTNKGLAQFETIKAFRVLPAHLTTDNYLTPSLKLKKKKLISDYEDLIDSMYDD